MFVCTIANYRMQVHLFAMYASVGWYFVIEFYDEMLILSAYLPFHTRTNDKTHSWTSKCWNKQTKSSQNPGILRCMCDIYLLLKCGSINCSQCVRMCNRHTHTMTWPDKFCNSRTAYSRFYWSIANELHWPLKMPLSKLPPHQ